MGIEYGDNNVAEQLWNAYYQRLCAKGVDVTRIPKIREAFYHGLYTGSDMVLKAFALDREAGTTFIKGFREQIKQGLKALGQGVFEGTITIQDKPRIIQATQMPPPNGELN